VVKLAIPYINQFIVNTTSPAVSTNIEARIIMTVKFFNNKLAAWEPVLEAWEVGLQAILIGKINNITVKANEDLKLNVSKPSINGLFNFLDLLESGQNEKRETHKGARKQSSFVATKTQRLTAFYPYVIYNKTGQNIRYWIDQDQVVG